MSDAHQALIRQFVAEIVSKGDLAVLDDLLTPTYRYHAPGMEVSGPEGMKQVFAMLRSGFPDWHESIEDLIAEGNKVVFRVVGYGTHQGNFMGIPATGKQVAVNGIDIVRSEGGKLAEHWAIFDQMGMLQQLGVIPAPGQG